MTFEEKFLADFQRGWRDCMAGVDAGERGAYAEGWACAWSASGRPLWLLSA